MHLDQSKSVEFGSGKIAIALIQRNGVSNSVAFIERTKEHPIAVDVDDDMTELEFTNGLRTVFTFQNVESIEAVLNQLNKLKEQMSKEVA